MSFYAKDSTITIKWAIAPNASPPVKSDFDIALVLPNGNATYVDDGITTYIAPTATVKGEATYDLTLTVVGLYQITLSIGTDAVHVINAHREIFSVIPPDHVLNGAAASLTAGPTVIPPPAPSWGASGNTFDADAISTFSGINLSINPDGTRIYWTESAERIHEIDMDAYDLSTAVSNAVSFVFTEGSGNKLSARWNGDGSSIWTATTVSSSPYLHRYDAITNYSLVGLSYASVFASGSSFPGMTFHYNFCWGDNGNSIYVSDPITLDRIIRYTLTTPYDPAGIVTATGQYLQLGTSPNNTVFREFDFNENGTELWVEQLTTSGGVTGYAILVYALSSAWDPSTGVLANTYITNGGVAGAGFVLANDNYVIFKSNAPDNTLIEWQLS